MQLKSLKKLYPSLLLLSVLLAAAAIFTETESIQILFCVLFFLFFSSAQIFYFLFGRCPVCRSLQHLYVLFFFRFCPRCGCDLLEYDDVGLKTLCRRHVLSDFFEEGTLKRLPARPFAKKIILEELVKGLESGKAYTRQELLHALPCRQTDLDAVLAELVKGKFLSASQETYLLIEREAGPLPPSQ